MAICLRNFSKPPSRAICLTLNQRFAFLRTLHGVLKGKPHDKYYPISLLQLPIRIRFPVFIIVKEKLKRNWTGRNFLSRIRIRIIYFSSTNELVNIRRQDITIMWYRMTIRNSTILSTDFPWRLKKCAYREPEFFIFFH
jgi:hypothetical protein